MSSSQIALIYRELLPPTAITSSTFLSICTDLDNCTFDDFLITAGATVLSVYRVCEGKLKKVYCLFFDLHPDLCMHEDVASIVSSPSIY